MNKYRNIGLALLTLLATACAEDQIKENGLLEEAPGGEENISATNPYWSWVGSFPGWISSYERRLELTSVEINGVYEKMDANNRIGFQQSPWISTGFYAAPGEPVTIVKPAGLSGKIKWRIGAWNCILPETATLKRYNKVYEEGEISGDTTKAMSYFGGHLYIIPEDPFTKPETFQIGGAVKSPDFISGETDAAAWKEAIKNTKVPFAELIGKKCIWTMPVTTLAKINTPQELLDLYDDVIANDFNALHGLSENATGSLGKAPSFPVRIVEDLQLCTGTSHTGYPIMFDMSDASIGTDVDDMRSTNVALNFYKEVGHNYQTWCWSWAGVKDIVNLLPYYYSRSRLLRAWPTSDTTDWDLVINEFVKKTSADKDFEMGSNGIGEYINKNNARVMPFIQLAQKYGWKLYAYLGKCSRELSDENAKILKILSSGARREFFCKRVCEYANADLRPFFDAWGIKYGPYAEADMKTLPAYTGEKFWEKWDKTLIPDFDAEQTPSSIKLPDNNYNNVSAQLDETLWSLDSAYNGPGTQENGPECLIDGRQEKGLNTASNGSHWGTPNKMKRPIYNPRPWASFDMGKAYNITQVHIWLRNHTSLHLHPQIFEVFSRLSPEDEWTSIGIFYMPATWNNNLLKKWHNFDVQTVLPARYVMISLIQAYPKSGKDPASYTEEGNASLEEFTVSGTIYTDAEEEGGSSGTDSDFPVWN